MKALNTFTQKLTEFKDKKYDNYSKAHHNSLLKTIKQRNVTRRKIRCSRTEKWEGQQIRHRKQCQPEDTGTTTQSAERNIIDTELYTQEKYISKTR